MLAAHPSLKSNLNSDFVWMHALGFLARRPPRRHATPQGRVRGPPGSRADAFRDVDGVLRQIWFLFCETGVEFASPAPTNHR